MISILTQTNFIEEIVEDAEGDTNIDFTELTSPDVILTDKNEEQVRKYK